MFFVSKRADAQHFQTIVDSVAHYTLSWDVRIANLAKVTGFPKALFIAEDGRVVGTWIMGQ